MEALDYATLAGEAVEKLRAEGMIVLSTCADNRVTARMMCHLNDDLEVLFSTSRNSQKVRQMEINPNVALTVDNLKIEGTAQLYGHPEGHPTFQKAYVAKFPHLGALYQSTPEDLLVIVKPKRIALYRYTGKPCEDILEPEAGRAYRIELT